MHPVWEWDSLQVQSFRLDSSIGPSVALDLRPHVHSCNWIRGFFSALKSTEHQSTDLAVTMPWMFGDWRLMKNGRETFTSIFFCTIVKKWRWSLYWDRKSQLTEEVDEKWFLGKRLLGFTTNSVIPKGNERSKRVVQFNIACKQERKGDGSALLSRIARSRTPGGLIVVPTS